MGQQQYITKEEHSKCRKIMGAFKELFKTEGSIMIDMGKYGFAKMENYEYPYGFEQTRFYTDSKNMFVELWMDWLYIYLPKMTEGTPLSIMDFDDILRNLSREKQEELSEKKKYFERKAGIPEQAVPVSIE